MENDIVMYTMGYLGARLALLMAGSYALYHYCLRPVPTMRRAAVVVCATRRAATVCDDRC